MKTFQTFDISAEYDAIHRTFPCHKDAPVIGLTGNFQEGACTLLEGYFTSILKAGGIPFIIPPVDETNSLINSLNALDGLLLTGGADINPLFLGEEPIKELHSINPRRDRQELLLAKLAADRQIPILGICRGIQVMNAAFGGSLYQDIHVQMEGERIKHDQDLGRGYASHTVRIEKDSLLYKLFETEILPVNSFHHQAVKEVAPGFRVTARSSDGVIEAMESTECKSMMGVQWHPECFILENNTCMMPVFHWLIQESTSFREAKKLHSRMITLDSHCDTPMFFDQGINFATRDKKILVDLHKMTEGHLDATIMVAYLKQLERTDEALSAATAKADRILNEIEEMVAKNCTAVDIAYTPADLCRLKKAGKKAVMLGIENGYAIGKDITNVERFRHRGVVYMTLCHNGNNDICGSARYNEEGLGVSTFGEQVIKEMNRVGMMVDVSHAGEKSFYDALAISGKPIVASHSSARALCDHPRNLTDAQISAIVHNEGVIGLNLCPGFLGLGRNMDAVLAHIDHFLCMDARENLCLGTDFDGIESLPEGITVEFNGENEQIMNAMGQLMLMLLLGVVLVYFIMVAQFQSLKSPFIVMFTIPLAFTGGFLALLIAGIEVSVISLIGFVMLVGVIVNNGIVLVDYINQLRLEGMGRREAIIEAGVTRLRPILMTSLTTILGLIVMAFGNNVGTALMQPVALVCIGGLLYATLMTLLVVPCMYDILSRRDLRKVDEEELQLLDM